MSAMPDRLAHIHGDEMYVSEKEQAYLEATWKAKAEETIGDPDYWRDWMFESNELTAAATECLARLMRNIDSAAKGELIGLNAIVTAVSNLQRIAREDAYEMEVNKS